MGPRLLGGGEVVEKAVVWEFCTLDLVNKEYARVCENHAEDTMGGPWSSHRIPELLGCVYHAFITEELWHALKKFKRHTTIDFRLLNSLVIQRIKELKPELF
jgi:hypothetical protein